MARPIYDFELTDPDFSWLLEQYQERHPKSIIISGTPVVLMCEDDEFLQHVFVNAPEVAPNHPEVQEEPKS